MLDVAPETIQAGETNGYIRSIGLKNGYNASGEDPKKFSSYILVTDKAVASMPMTPKTPNGADNTVNNKEIVYSGTEQSCFENGEHCEITAGGFTGINAGMVSVTVRPESGYIWSDGTAGEKTIQNEIKKHNQCVRYKSEIVLVNGTPKYEVEYGYSTPVISFTSESSNFVNGETPDTVSGFVAPTVPEHTTDVTGDYVLTPPTTAVEDNATLTIYKDGTMSVTVPVKNAVFTLQKLGNCEALSEGDVKITKRNGNYGEKMSRIDSITIPVTEKEGTFVFNRVKQVPCFNCAEQ